MKNLYLILLVLSTFSSAQDRYTFPIYPDCPYSEKNDELKNCLLSKLSEKLKLDIDPSIISQINEKGIKRLIIYFNVEKDGKLTSFKTPSYSETFLSNYFIEKFKKISLELDNEGKHITPAMFNSIPGKIQLSIQLEF